MAEVPEGGIVGLLVGGATVWLGRALAIAAGGWVKRRLLLVEHAHERERTEREVRTDMVATELSLLDQRDIRMWGHVDKQIERLQDDIDRRIKKEEELDEKLGRVRRQRDELYEICSECDKCRPRAEDLRVDPQDTSRFSRSIIPKRPAPERRAALTGVDVLLLEDDVSVAKNLAIRLQQEGAAVVIAHDTEEALAYYDQGTFHALVVDLHLPGRDGLTFLRTVRAKDAARGRAPAPAIAVSGYDAAEWEPKAKAAGFLAYCEKPVGVEGLPALLAGLVEDRGK